MKCKNCAANYKTRELKCPYCGTENLLGRIWQVERTQAEWNYEKEKKEVKKKIFSPYMADRILNRCLVVIVCLYIVSIAVVFLVFYLGDVFQKAAFAKNKDKIEAQMAAYYDAGEFEKLDLYMDDKILDHKEYYAYTQATILNFDYNRYMEYRLGFLALSEEEKLEDDYYLEYALENSRNVYNLECGIYDEPVPENEALYEFYRKEIMAYWVGTLQLSDEEIECLTDRDVYYVEEMDSIIEGIKARGCGNEKKE